MIVAEREQIPNLLFHQVRARAPQGEGSGERFGVAGPDLRLSALRRAGGESAGDPEAAG